MNDEFKTLKKFEAGKGREGFLYSLPALEEQGVGTISRLPVSIRIVLESVLRNCDGEKVRRKDVETLAKWNAKKPANEEIPFVVARIVVSRIEVHIYSSSRIESCVQAICVIAFRRKASPTDALTICSSSGWCRVVWSFAGTPIKTRAAVFPPGPPFSAGVVRSTRRLARCPAQ